MLRFSANLGFLWPDRPLLERIAAAAAAGFKAVEFHWPYGIPAARLRAACRQAGVHVISINTPAGNMQAGEYGLGALPGREAEFAEGLDQAVRYAREIGAGAIHVMAGIVSDTDKERGKDALAQNLLSAAARTPDLTFLLEPLNPRDCPGYLYSTVEEVAAIIACVEAVNVKMMFDVYHVAVGQGDVLTRLQRHHRMIGHVQIAAVPRRVEPDEGEIAYKAVFASLEQLGYAGSIGCEYRPRGSTDEGLSWVKTLGVSL